MLFLNLTVLARYSLTKRAPWIDLPEDSIFLHNSNILVVHRELFVRTDV
jgi:hypothetical protein